MINSLYYNIFLLLIIDNFKKYIQINLELKIWSISFCLSLLLVSRKIKDKKKVKKLNLKNLEIKNKNIKKFRRLKG